MIRHDDVISYEIWNNVLNINVDIFYKINYILYKSSNLHKFLKTRRITTFMKKVLVFNIEKFIYIVIIKFNIQ